MKSYEEPGKWFLRFMDGTLEVIEITRLGDKTLNPQQVEYNSTWAVLYDDGSMRIYPWSAIKSAVFEPIDPA